MSEVGEGVVGAEVVGAEVVGEEEVREMCEEVWRGRCGEGGV